MFLINNFSILISILFDSDVGLGARHQVVQVDTTVAKIIANQCDFYKNPSLYSFEDTMQAFGSIGGGQFWAPEHPTGVQTDKMTHLQYPELQ